MSGHTPGPWVAVPLTKRTWGPRPVFTDGLWAILRAEDPTLLPIAEVDRGSDHHAPTRAKAGIDARLIAAAPDLLECLKEAARDFSIMRMGHRMEKWDAAIAKAEGRS